MRFMTRSLLAISLLAVTLAILALAGWQVASAIQERNARSAGQRPAEERVFTVNVEPISLSDARPVITAFGEVESWRELELRTAASGTLIEISDAFRDGGTVASGAVIYRIDPTDAKADLRLAETQVKEAEAELIEARAALELATAELAAATEQRALRDAALARQKDLRTRGVGSEAAVETAALAQSSAAQTVIARRQAMAQARARILRAEIGVERQEISRAETERRLGETVATAPFDGIFADVGVAVGRQIGMNELLGKLIDPAALEVAFRVSNAQFARLVDERGQVRAVDITATLDLAGAPIRVAGTLDRAGAEVGEGQTGRLLYARLDPTAGRGLRPGDFLRVDIQEPVLPNVAEVAATAVRSDGSMLLLGADDRLEVHRATIQRQQADTVIIGDVPEGREYVVRLQPQLGLGVKVKPIRPGAGIEVQKMVALDADRRAALVAYVEGNTRMPAQAKRRVLDRLKADAVPEEFVARLESRMNGGGGGNGGGGNRRGNNNDQSGGRAADSGETITLDDARRDRLIAFVTANDRMPAEAKDRILSMVKSGAAPADMVARLERRMGEAGVNADDTTAATKGATTSAPNAATGSDGDTIAIDPERRARLVAFVEGNNRMPEAAKDRILSQLRQADVPAALINRLEARMGG